jgi:hypothetical protein
VARVEGEAPVEAAVEVRAAALAAEQAVVQELLLRRAQTLPPADLRLRAQVGAQVGAEARAAAPAEARVVAAVVEDHRRRPSIP